MTLVRLLTHAAALMAGAALTLPAAVAAQTHDAGSRKPDPTFSCKTLTAKQAVCRINLDLSGPDAKLRFNKFRLTFALNGDWEYIDNYWPHGRGTDCIKDPQPGLCRTVLRERHDS